jgi:hypothetical protein
MLSSKHVKSFYRHFQVDMSSDKEAAKIFSVPDFVGDACKAIASRVRGAVAGVQFDDFHKNSAKIIRSSVFGFDENRKVHDSFLFPQNNLVITSIDVQSVEPVDQRTRDALQKSVQLAIEITTNSQEAAARLVPPPKRLFFLSFRHPLAGMRPRGWSRKPRVVWRGSASVMKLKLKEPAKSSLNCRPTVLRSKAQDRPRLKLRAEQKPLALKARQLWSKQPSKHRL